MFSLSVSIVMGVPSVKREVHSYLTDTLSSLMSELSQAEKEDCVIVVFIAEVGLRPFVTHSSLILVQGLWLNFLQERMGVDSASCKLI